MGKTALVQMYASEGQTFVKNYKLTAGVDLVVASRPVPDSQYVLETYFYDVGGQEVFQDLAPDFVQDANLVMIVYDVTSQDSFSKCEKWFQLCRKKRGYGGKLLGCLVGKKSDLKSRHSVRTQVGQEWALDHGLEFFEVSCKGKSWEAPFKWLVDQFHQRYKDHLARTQEAAKQYFLSR